MNPFKKFSGLNSSPGFKSRKVIINEKIMRAEYRKALMKERFLNSMSMKIKRGIAKSTVVYFIETAIPREIPIRYVDFLDFWAALCWLTMAYRNNRTAT
jgi:hypothetical protein